MYPVLYTTILVLLRTHKFFCLSLPSSASQIKILFFLPSSAFLLLLLSLSLFNPSIAIVRSPPGWNCLFSIFSSSGCASTLLCSILVLIRLLVGRLSLLSSSLLPPLSLSFLFTPLTPYTQFSSHHHSQSKIYLKILFEFVLSGRLSLPHSIDPPVSFYIVCGLAEILRGIYTLQFCSSFLSIYLSIFLFLFNISSAL